MKVNKILAYSLIAIAMLSVQVGWSKGQSEKKKVMEKSYSVKPSTILNLKNKFGKIEINAWDKNQFAIKVEAIGRGRNDERAQKILDQISIDFDEGSSEVSIETVIDNMKNKSDEGFEVNYIISMPEANPLEVKNSFGDVYMANRLGDLDINVSYGSMKIGDVLGKTNLKLSFGNGDISNIQNGDIVIKYSKFNIESGKEVELEQSFSEVELGNVQDLDLISKYGNVEIEKAHTIDARVQFSGFEIDELTGKLALTASYLSDFEIKRLAKSFTLVDIEGKFGSYEIGLEPGLNAQIDAEFSFADLKSYSDVDVNFSYRVKESNKSYYKGTIGSGDESKLIRIDSSYGNLRLKED